MAFNLHVAGEDLRHALIVFDQQNNAHACPSTGKWTRKVVPFPS